MGYSWTDDRSPPAAEEAAAQANDGSGSWFEALCGALGLVVAALGMHGLHPTHMAAIATISAGFGVLAEAGTIAAWSTRAEDHHAWSSVGVVLVGGLAAVVLGCLVLLHAAPATSLPLAGMALGGALVFAGRAQPARIAAADAPRARRSAAPQVVMVVAGGAALALALLASIYVGSSELLTLIAVASAGAGLVVAGGAPPSRG